MSEYNPDVWVSVEITENNVGIVRILAGWYGGYAGSDSWKLSSGVVKVIDTDTHWEIYNQSGSVYRCRKQAERFSGYTSSIFSTLSKQNTDSINIQHVEFDSVKERFMQ
jgi:hypothetical protein